MGSTKKAGTQIVAGAGQVFGWVELVVKVKEPQPEEWGLAQVAQGLFNYLHLALNPDLVPQLMESGRLPSLAPMRHVADRVVTR